MTKPFSAKELVARVKAVLRRTKRPEERATTTLVCGELEINFARRTVKMGDQQVSLTRAEYALLRQLALNVDRVMLHQDLLTKVWGPEYRMTLTIYESTSATCDLSWNRNLQILNTSSPSQEVGYLLVCPKAEEAAIYD